MIWRYDPIVLSSVTTVDFHRETYARIAAALDGCTRRSVISLMDVYRKAEKRLRDMSREGVTLAAEDDRRRTWWRRWYRTWPRWPPAMAWRS